MLFSFGIVKSHCVLLYCIMLFRIGLCSSVLYYALPYWTMFFCIVLCSSVLDYVLLYCIMFFRIGLCSSVLYYALPYRIMFFCIVLCFSVLNYGKVNYAYVISFMALSEQNLDDWVGNGSSVSKWRTMRRGIVWQPEITFAMFFLIFWDSYSRERVPVTPWIMCNTE